MREYPTCGSTLPWCTPYHTHHGVHPTTLGIPLLPPCTAEHVPVTAVEQWPVKSVWALTLDIAWVERSEPLPDSKSVNLSMQFCAELLRRSESKT